MINDEIKVALQPLNVPVVADIYNGQENIFVTFNVNTVPIYHGDNHPRFIKSLIQIHLFAPLRQDVIALRDNIVTLLFKADFTWPTETNNTDDTGQHYVYECESIEVPNYGDPDS